MAIRKTLEDRLLEIERTVPCGMKVYGGQEWHFTCTRNTPCPTCSNITFLLIEVRVLCKIAEEKEEKLRELLQKVDYSLHQESLQDTDKALAELAKEINSGKPPLVVKVEEDHG